MPLPGAPRSTGRLPCSIRRDRATLEVFDVAGRLLEQREVGGLGAGRHVLSVGGGRRMPAGLYLIRLNSGSRSLTAGACVLQ
jgi:hypothetical protein